MKVYLGETLEGSVFEPIGHLACFGQTRRAGKTTSLRTLVRRLTESREADALIFRTGRGEIAFPGAALSRPFFRAALDWRSVEAMLWTFLAEKPKVYRPIIMDAVRGARSLEDVHRAIVARGAKSKNGWVADRTKELDAYFQEILPWLKEHEFGYAVDIESGQNLVDLEGWPETVQQLVVASTLDFLMANAARLRRPLILVLPEARTFIPSDRATPVRLAADRVARMGAKLNLFLWVDSQALTGVDQQVLRNFALLLQGVQTSDIEIHRISKAIDGVKPSMVRALRVGDFILHTQDGVRTVHVPLSAVVKPKVEGVDDKERKTMERRIEDLENSVHNREARIRALEEDLNTANAEKAELVRTLADEHRRVEANARAAATNAVTAMKRAPHPGAPVEGGGSATPDQHTHLEVTTDVPCLVVKEQVVTVRATTDDHRGKLALLVAEGFFDEKRSTGPIGKEYAARGWGYPTGGNSAQALRAALVEMCAWGFLRNFNGLYSSIPEAKARIRRERVEIAA